MRLLGLSETSFVAGGIATPSGTPSGNLFDAAETRPEGSNAWGETPGGSSPYAGGYWDDGTSCRPSEQGLQTVVTLPGPMGVIDKAVKIISKILD